MAGIQTGGEIPGFGRAGAIGPGGAEPSAGQLPPGMGGQPQAAPGFKEAMQGAQAAPGVQPGQGPEAISPMEMMQKQMGTPTMEALQQRMGNLHTNTSELINRLQTQNIQSTDQLPGGRAVQLIGEKRLDQMHEATGALSSIMGSSYTPPAKGTSLIDQIAGAQSQFNQLGQQMSNMSAQGGGMDVTSMLRAQSQMQKIEQTMGFFSTATGEAISGAKQLFTQQI
jgi:hypothetical protein